MAMQVRLSHTADGDIVRDVRCTSRGSGGPRVSARSEHVRRLLRLLPREVADLHGPAAIGWAERDPQIVSEIDARAARLLIAVVSYEYVGTSWDRTVRSACDSVHKTWTEVATAYARRDERNARTRQ